MSVSLAAYVKGFLEYKKDSHIKGVIFNQMSPMLYPRMKKLLEEELDVAVLGYVPKVEDCVIESRHLGLVLPDEIPELKDRLHKLAGVLEETLDIDRILELAGEAPDLLDAKPESVTDFRLSEPVRIGVAEDEAFCFFYADNFRLLGEMGAEIVPFSPMEDKQLPDDLDGLLVIRRLSGIKRKKTGTKYHNERHDTGKTESRDAMYGRMRRLYVSPRGNGGHGWEHSTRWQG